MGEIGARISKADKEKFKKLEERVNSHNAAITRLMDQISNISYELAKLRNNIQYVLYGLLAIGILHGVVLVKNLFWG